MEIETTRFGVISLGDDIKVFGFAEGILGFPEFRQYVVLDNPSGGVFQWLQSTEKSDLAFVICDPLVFKSDYSVPITRADLGRIGAEKIEEVQVRVIMTVKDKPEDMTANMQGPIIFNIHSLQARQLVLSDDLGYSTQHHVIPKGSNAGSVSQD